MKLEFFRKKQRKTEQPSWTSLSKQSKTKKKNFPSGSRVYETRVPLGKTEQNRAPYWTSLSKQSKTKKKNFPVELESMKLEFHWKKQSRTEHPFGPL